MKDTCYLVFDSDGIRRMTKNWPSLTAGELAVRVRVSVPPEAFRKPIPTANLEVPEEAIVTPEFEATVEIET